MAGFISILDHLQSLDTMADSQSEYINDNLPSIVVLLEGCMIITERFIDGL